MKLKLTKSTSLDTIVFLLMLLFIYAALSKVLTFDLFVAQIGKSPLITAYAATLAWAVPAVELIISVLLFFPKTRLVGMYGAFTLMFAFTAYIAFILTFSPYVPCSCGGILNSMGWTEHLIFNAVFTILALIGIAIMVRNKPVQAVIATA